MPHDSSPLTARSSSAPPIHSSGTIINSQGLDVEALIALKGRGRSVVEFSGGDRRDRDPIVAVDCDIWIPAARPDVITMANVDSLRAKLVLQGANIPASSEAEERMHQRGILSIPDFIANEGGVICAAVEYHGGTQSTALVTIEEKLRNKNIDDERRKNHQSQRHRKSR